jgi:hypothetical protein
VQLVLLDEMQQEIQRPLEVVEMDGIGVEDRVEFLRLHVSFAV